MQPILQHLFQVSVLEDVSRERLESFVEAYPSFGIGHFLLSRKLQTEDPGRFQEETQRTCLYFSNPFWLQWLLENTEASPGAGQTGQVDNNRPHAEDRVIEEPVLVEPVREEAAPEMPAGENVVTVAEEAYPEIKTGDDLAEALTDGGPEAVTVEEYIGTSAGEGETMYGQESPAMAETGAVPEPTAAELLLRSIEEAREIRDSLQKLNENFAVETAMAGEGPEEPVALPAEGAVVDAATVRPVEEPIRDEEPSPEPATAGQDILFEPYHTIDYFASQGIRLSLDENPADMLGKQLKSFTEWLKSMRRLPQKDREVVPDRVTEEAVQTIAAHSIEGKDVVTETMAEVLAKQGMRDRARAVYEKLSLLNPDKRAYFAAKIEQLNIL